jgi:glycosyltransferase involved in cell wall biosynthesis
MRSNTCMMVNKLQNILLIAYHFPPEAGSSGFLRTLKFVRYLPDHGWHPTVLSVATRVYDRMNTSLIPQVPDNVRVLRPFCLNTSKDLSIKGYYPGWLALPDRWISWMFSGVPAGLNAIRRERISVLFSTFPIVTAVVIGLVLKKITKLPWVVDFRDSMTEPDYPRDKRTRRVCQWVERQAVAAADRILFTTPSTRKMYLERYPKLREENCLVIRNGYDEDDFKDLDFSGTKASPVHPLRLLHLGLLYPEERDPSVFFSALSDLKKRGTISSSSVTIDFRASGSENYYTRMIKDKNLDDIVHLLPALPYHDALKDAVNSDALMIFQDKSCDHQIPAKLYEYLRLRKPILALTSYSGDTAQLLKSSQSARIMDLKNYEDIKSNLPVFLASLESQSYPTASPDFVTQFERRNLTAELAFCLDGLIHPISDSNPLEKQPAPAHEQFESINNNFGVRHSDNDPSGP